LIGKSGAFACGADDASLVKKAMEVQMSDRSISLFTATVATLALAGSAQAQGLKQIATIALPDTPITQLGVMTIDQTTGLG
jgi:hypothetical protein